MPSLTSWSFDRPRFYALAVSALTGTLFELPGVETWTWSKSDDGNSGQFSIRVPLNQDYDSVLRTSAPGTEVYAASASPNDLIALYAQRQSVSGDGYRIADAIKPDLTGIHWGDADAASVTRLGTANCIFIGMVDGARVSGSPGGEAILSIQGRDLTKIFETNWVGIPDTSVAAQAGLGNTASGEDNFYLLQNFALSKLASGATFLVQVLDFLCAKNVGALADLGGFTADPAAAAQYLSFGFPYKNFIRLDGIDANYLPLDPKQKAYPPYTAQAGAVWATVMELRNSPISRIFVNELGQLIYDDALTAWTGFNYTGAAAQSGAYGAIAGTIGPEDIRDYDFGFSDATLLTFLSVLPNNATMGLGGMMSAMGTPTWEGNANFVNGVMEAKNASDAHIATYGYRYGQYESQFDMSFPAAALRRKVILTSVNNLNTGSITVRGRPDYRVGTRWNVALDTGRPDTSNQPWYIASVEHQGTWGEDWTTSLELRYPPPVGAAATSPAPGNILA